MKYSVPFGIFEILEASMCLASPSQGTFHCYNGSWMIEYYKGDNDKEYYNYRVAETSCQADAFSSEYIQQNWLKVTW